MGDWQPGQPVKPVSGCHSWPFVQILDEHAVIFGFSGNSKANSVFWVISAELTGVSITPLLYPVSH